MEWLSKLSEQVADRCRALPLPLRVAGLVLGVAVLGGLIMLGAGGAEGPCEPLFDGRNFSPRELAKMTAAFQAAGLKGARLADGRILVPKANLDAYLVALHAADVLPGDFDDALDHVAAASSPFASRQQTEMGYRLAEQKRLARILSGMNGIETASVQYGEVKKPGFPPTSEMRAVVAVRAGGKRPLTYEEIEAVRDTVVGYVAGLDRTQVTVSDLNACRAYPGGGDAAGLEAASYAARAEQARLEEDFRVKIQKRLAAYPGAIVGVNVQLHEAGSDFGSGSLAARRQLTPALISASIDLPKSYFALVCRERAAEAGSSAAARPVLPAVEREVKEAVEQAVLALLPPPAFERRGIPQVVVTSYEDLPLSGAPTAGDWQAAAVTWMAENWYWAFAVSLPAASILLWLRRRQRDAIQAAVCRAASVGPAHRGPRAEDETGSPSLSVLNPDMQLELRRAVQEDPEAAVQALQRWLSKAA